MIVCNFDNIKVILYATIEGFANDIPVVYKYVERLEHARSCDRMYPICVFSRL